MRVLLVHNFYQQRGGEDAVFAAEAAMLREAGHDVLQHSIHNDAIDGMTRIGVAARTIWNFQSAKELTSLIVRFGPEVVHFHNTFPLISPAAPHAAKDAGAAVVMTLHNYRLLCPAATFHRDGRVCEDCLATRTCWPGVVHRCYRDGLAASVAVAATLTFHRLARTWHSSVDRFIALTDFARNKFVEGGLPPDRIAVKPNFVHPTPTVGDGAGQYAVFAGRLTAEKGIATLLRAWDSLRDLIPLHIIGDGPLAPLVTDAVQRNPAIRFLGRQSHDATLGMIGQAAFLVFPSEWYEGLPCTIVEAFAKGTPVIASRLGAMVELIAPGLTGIHFTPGDPVDLACQVRRLVADRAALSAMRLCARQEFEQRYTARTNREMLLGIYRSAITASQAAPPARRPRTALTGLGNLRKKHA